MSDRLYHSGTGWRSGVGVVALSVARQEIPELVRQARDAETAHLEAVLKTHGAAYLRLAGLRDHINASDLAAPQYLELRALPGEAPALWLDLAHAITMEPDARTFQLTHYGPHDRQVLVETDDQAEVLGAVRKLNAHGRVIGSRQEKLLQSGWAFATLFYVWLTGIVTGSAVLALYLIYMNKMDF